METSETQVDSPHRVTWDLLATELQSLRRSAGDPSYAEIARRISERRLGDGATEHAARVARTTVYDAFRTGRARVNLGLVREIASALGADDALVDGWVARCREDDRPAEATGVSVPVAVPAEAATIDVPEPAPPPARRHVLLLMLACVAVNLLGRSFVDLFHLPIFLDMVGTAIAAIALGPWRGAAVGLATNLIGVLPSGAESIPFAAVNVLGALVWGYGVHRFRLGLTLARFFLLSVLAAVACSLVAVPILVFLYGGFTSGHGDEHIVATFLELTQQLYLAVSVSNLLVSMADKLISGFVALVAISALPLAMRAGLPLVLADAGDRR
ncbi:ECF transporter S component [Nocardioides ferulae]|uniref:ECF transporter S component n=1 Tax=Nocardioides ferulae TaxID=2340821 RepID=UPI000EAFDC56|nr:ECF transporter S component [Nocardioides ferulae]